MKKIGYVLTLSAILTTTSLVADTAPNNTIPSSEKNQKLNWKEFKDEKVGIKAHFPSDPQTFSTQMPEFTFDIYNSVIPGPDNKEGEGAAYGLFIKTFPDTPQSADMTSQKGLETAAKKVQEIFMKSWEVQDSNIHQMKFRNQPAYSISVTSPTKMVRSVIFILNNKQYMLNYMGDKSLFSEEDFKNFLDHFEILNNNENATEKTPSKDKPE